MPDSAVDAALAAALKGRRHIRMLYSSWGDAERRWRDVAPHGLLLGTRRYLVAHDVQRGDKVLRHYRLEGIIEVEILGQGFEPDPGFDLAAHAKADFSSYVNAEEIERVVWRSSAEAADRARRFVFHPDQMVEENGDGTIAEQWGARAEGNRPRRFERFLSAEDLGGSARCCARMKSGGLPMSRRSGCWR